MAKFEKINEFVSVSFFLDRKICIDGHWNAIIENDPVLFPKLKYLKKHENPFQKEGSTQFWN